jgi:uncharacterized membrane protein YtjA (UPF0391 family)
MPTRIAVASDSAIETEHPSFENGVQPCRGEPALLRPLRIAARPVYPVWPDRFRRTGIMLKWALVFFIVSLVAGVFGFTGIAAGAAAVAKVLFYVAVILFLVFLVLGLAAMRALK